MPPRSSSHFIFGCGNSFWARSRSRSMRPWRQCSIPAVDARRRDTSGRSPAMTGPGAGRVRPLSHTPMRPAPAPPMHSSCSRPIAAKSVIAEAIRYGLNHWDGLPRFLEDGRIELDTNIVERGMRPIALNRKNALFAGHDQGAENWAAIASLVETCKLHGVDPQAYFADALTKLVNLWPASRLDELMPWACAAQRSTDRLAA